MEVKYFTFENPQTMTANLCKMTFEFSLNIFTKFAEFSDKIIWHYSKRAQTCHLL